ncbi:MAG: hypothetical protein IKN96_04630 [Oscillibacter sp.]|nr:hypothetical protein [Oscillibacter sp.]
MRLSHKKLRGALFCVLCAAALTFPAIASDARSAAAPSDNGAAFYGYLLWRAGESDEASLWADARSKLGDKDKELYDKLKAFAADIADGVQTEAVYTITYDDFPLTWTAEQLGVPAILELVNGKAQFAAGCEAAVDAKLAECYGYDLNAVGAALLADCPYELYWYDKSANPPIRGNSEVYYGADSYQVKFSAAPTYTVTMAVSADYRGGSETAVNRNLHAGIDNVVSKAAEIVNAYKGKSDYEKLLGYATEICAMTDYDHSAASGGANAVYGDPWQLISVFDGDPATKVVCEGYAKAFKYLCDLSAFDSPKVECRLATGLLAGDEAQGAGAHMWNVVTMENGKNYLTDLTNSDNDYGPSYLFLRGGIPDAPAQYTFEDMAFVYDPDALALWGGELLTLDTADYAPTTPAPISAPVRVRGCSLTLADDIALNFCLSFDDEILSDGGAYAKLSGIAPADAQTLLVSAAPRGTVSGIEGTVYYFTAHMPAKRMNDPITLACYDGDGKPYAMVNPAGDAVTEFKYCVGDYLRRAFSEPELKSLAEAMSAYGYYAQKLFAYDAENAAAPSASYASKVAAVTADALSAYAPQDGGSVDGVSVLGDNLTLDASVTQRWIFTLSGSPSDYVFTLDGATVAPKAYPDAGASAYCVEVPGVAAKDMDKSHTLTVSKGGETLTHACSTLSYAYTALSDGETSADLQNLVRAMWLYHREAKAYFQNR